MQSFGHYFCFTVLGGVACTWRDDTARDHCEDDSEIRVLLITVIYNLYKKFIGDTTDRTDQKSYFETQLKCG